LVKAAFYQNEENNKSKKEGKAIGEKKGRGKGLQGERNPQ